MNIETGSIINQYKIISPIGKGGMGEVFLAQDTKLDRKVALKILPGKFADDKDRMSRFIREAKSASALNHPNIITIYEIGESEGTHFIATEFIDGKTLHDCAKSNSLDLKSILDIAIQVASGLDEAHSAGIVHRDIKPDNVMVRSNGLAKILDFGIAKLSAPTESSEDAATAIKSGTSPGMVIGTANYMSPEQAKGKDVDARSDVFSFGVVLYEMLAGHLPFAGETPMETIAAIINLEPKPLGTHTVPPEVAKIINKTLRKDRNERYQTIKDLLIDLKDVKQELDFQDKLQKTVSPNNEEPKTQLLKATTLDEGHQATTGGNQNDSITIRKSNLNKGLIGVLAILLISVMGFLAYRYFSPANKQIESIAVMPFENKSSDADTDYLSDGLAESLIYRLSQLPNLKVSPTSSVFRYKGRAIDPQVIAKELGVDSVMTGRITQRGDNLTISVNLVDARNGKSLWGELYERKMSELLATQREIAAEITSKLQLKLSGKEKGLTKQYTTSNEAYQLYLKGRYHFAKRTKDDIQRGIDYFQQAIKLDPNFALAAARIAESYVSMPAYPHLSPNEAVPQAKVAAKRALEIDPSLAEGHTFLAYTLAIYDWNWEEAEREFKRGIELDPNNASAHFRYGQIYLAPMGRSDEAIAEVKRALEIEPLDLNMGGNLAWVYLSARRLDLALDQGTKTYELDTNFATARWNLSQAYLGNGMYSEAIATNEKSLETDPTSQFMLMSVGIAHAKTGRRQEAEEVIKRFKAIAKTHYVISYFVAAIQAALGDKDKAFAELENAFAGRDWYLHRLKVDPFWDSLRNDPRFKAMLKRMNLPE